jgi:hypothetical protein
VPVTSVTGDKNVDLAHVVMIHGGQAVTADNQGFDLVKGILVHQFSRGERQVCGLHVCEWGQYLSMVS